jgi:hypothetical protein
MYGNQLRRSGMFLPFGVDNCTLTISIKKYQPLRFFFKTAGMVFIKSNNPGFLIKD